MTDLEKRIEEIFEDMNAGLRFDDLPGRDYIGIAKQKVLELVKDCVPKKVADKTMWGRGYNACRIQTINNVKGDSNE